MLHPLPLDFLDFLLPLFLGALAFAFGRFSFRLLKPYRYALIVLSIGTIAIVGLSFTDILPQEISAFLFWMGGASTVLGWMALLLLGIVWNVPGRSLSSGFLTALSAVAACMLFIQVSGPLWWRFFAPQLWARTADERGCLQQATGLTCSPAAAVMLLHHYGIAASEGEMAYLAKTSLFGTEGRNMARALSYKVQQRGWHAVFRSVDYEGCIRAGESFIAHVEDPRFGGHAVLLLNATSANVEVVDPIDGLRRKMPRSAFERVWDGTIIQVIRQGE